MPTANRLFRQKQREDIFFGHRIHFLKTAIFDRNVGAVSASSRYLVKKVLGMLPKKELKLAIEYGPGNGALTKKMLQRLAPDGQLIVIESNSVFVKQLRKIEDHRLRVIPGEVQGILPELLAGGLNGVDVIVTSIPFSFLSEADRRAIISASRELLSPRGLFIVFHQYVPVAALSLKHFFEAVDISFVLRNIFPCFIMVAYKDAIT